VYAVSVLLAPVLAFALPSPTVREVPKTAVEGLPAAHRPFPWRQMTGICALTFFGAMVFYTVPAEMSYLLDDLGVENTGVIGLAKAGASAATVAGAITFARLKRSPDPMLPAVLMPRWCGR
jgi:hypothetical protein